MLRSRLQGVSILVAVLILSMAVWLSFVTVHWSQVNAQEEYVPMIYITPQEDELAILSNPDMGWVLYENYPLDRHPSGSSNIVRMPDYAWPGVDHVAIMFSWQDIEIAEGVYDFSKVDYAYDWWQSRGKKIQLRLSTESLLWWSNAVPPAGLGIPRYVIDRLPEQSVQVRSIEGLRYTVVDAREPYYLERLRAFLEAVSEHYSEERSVEMIDLRGFGVWGEWHSGYLYDTVEDRREALKAIIDAYTESFPDHFLSLSYSYDPDGPDTYYTGSGISFYDPLATYDYEGFKHYSAFDLGMTKPNITWRRDGAGSSVHSNERRLAAEVFHRMGSGPFMSEFGGSYEVFKSADRLQFAVDDALSLHPNFVNLLGWQSYSARAFLEEQPDLVEYGLRHMGYRLVPILVGYPETVPSNGSFPLESRWINRGVGRAIEDYRLEVILKDDRGMPVVTHDAGYLGTDRWIRDNEYFVQHVVSTDGIPVATYDLFIKVTDPRTGAAISLPLFDHDGEGAYYIGSVEVGAVSTEAAFANARKTGRPGEFRHVSPAMRAAFVDMQPVFEWESAEGASHYRLVLSLSPGLTDPVIAADDITGTTYSTDLVLQPYTTYYWRVEALNDAGSRIAYNGVYELTTATSQEASGADHEYRFVIEGDEIPERLIIRQAKAAVISENSSATTGEKVAESRAPGADDLDDRHKLLRLDGYGVGHEWIEYAWTDPNLSILQTGGNYRIQFGYTVLDQPPWGGEQFYALLRVHETTDFTTDRGATFFGGLGQSGQVEIEVFLNPNTDYYLLIGSRYDNSSLAIKDLVIEKME